jgi:nitroreductase
VQDQARREQLNEAAMNQAFIAQAPVSLVFCCDPLRAKGKYGERGERLYALQDATIAAAYAQLAIVAAGLGSTWVGHFDEEKLKDALGIAPGLEPVAILCVGYPAELPEESPRRHLDEMVTTL